MKKKHTKEKKGIRVEESHTNYAGTEKSPYREWLEDSGDYNQEHQAEEPAEANPDQVAESDGLYFQDTCTDERLIAVNSVIDELTERQKLIVRMCGNEGRTIENCAATLRISRGTVQKTLDRVRERVNRRLTKQGYSGV
jgi:RNA polymerase sigma factor (sigma-70 family)